MGGLPVTSEIQRNYMNLPLQDRIAGTTAALTHRHERTFS